jgi:hypothetical protein
MKKLFKYEINESIAAKAAMNCVHKRLFKELYAFGAPMPQEEVTRGEYDPYEWEFDDYGNEDKRQLVIQALVQAGLIQSEQEGVQLNNKIQQIMDKTGFTVSNEQDAMKFVKAYGQQIVGDAQEQEETDYTNDDIPSYHFSYQNSFLVWAMRHVIPYLKEMSKVCAQADPTELKHAVMKVLKEEGRFGAPESEGGCEDWAETKRWKVEEFLGGETQEQEEDGINKGGMHNLVQVGHIMNTPSMHDTYDSEWFSDLEEQEAYYENFRVIAELVADQIDRENGKAIENNMDTLFEIVKEVWKNNSNDLYIYDDVDEYECQEFFDKHYEEIKNEYMKREHDNIMAATHDDLFASENEEEDYSNDSHGIEMIIDLMIAKHMISDEPKIRQIAWKLIERKLNEEGMFIGDDDHEAERFVSFFGEDLVEEIAYWRW